MRLTDQDVRKVAADANVDPRTVARTLKEGGKRQSRVVRAAIVASLRKFGWKAEAVALERDGK